MPSNIKKSGARAARLLAPAGIAAALLAGAFGFATAAQATTPTPPTVALSMPAQLSNDNGAQPAHIVINNTASGSVAITNASLLTTFTLPAGLPCNHLSVNGTAITGQGAGPTCTVNVPVPALAAGGSPITLNFTVAVDGVVTSPSNPPVNITGTITTVTVLNQLSAPGGTVTNTLATSNTETTQLVIPTAPSFNGTPPAATVHQAYSYQLIADRGISNHATTIHVYKNGALAPLPTTTDPVSHDVLVALNSQFTFDETTGVISATAASLAVTKSDPADSFQVVANNGVGGLSATPAPAMPFVVHDVVTPSFTLPILFSDVRVVSLFGPSIYALADQGIIGGYLDGTFRPATPVTRAAFARYIAKVEGYASGPCTGASPFSDVAASNQFCADISSLVSHNIVNGFGDGTFHPNAVINRQEIAAFIYRTHQVDVHQPTTDLPCTAPIPFNDVTTRNPFCGDIEWLSANHIASGFTDGGFHPAVGALRQDSAKFIDNLAILDNLL